jgi:hypothetical protein
LARTEKIIPFHFIFTLFWKKKWKKDFQIIGSNMCFVNLGKFILFFCFWFIWLFLEIVRLKCFSFLSSLVCILNNWIWNFTNGHENEREESWLKLGQTLKDFLFWDPTTINLGLGLIHLVLGPMEPMVIFSPRSHVFNPRPPCPSPQVA